MILIAIALLASSVWSQILDAVLQQTAFEAYANDLKFDHLYQDSPFHDYNDLIQVDTNNTYIFARQGYNEPELFTFKKIQHSDKSLHDIYENIYLEGYTVNGFCQYDGQLDYILGIEKSSRKLLLYTIKANQFTSKMELYTKKEIHVDGIEFVEDRVFIDCQFRGRKFSQNYYTIGIAGSYFDSTIPFIQNLFAAKFDTYSNFTEWNYFSDDQNVNEQVKGVHLDKTTNKVMVAVDVNVNKYFNQTVYDPGEKPEDNNPNIAIVCFDEHFATRLWVALVGSPVYQDYFANMGSWGNYLYVATTSHSTYYHSDPTKTDIYYVKIRIDNGFKEYKTVIGSESNDVAYDLQVNQQGVFILAEFGDHLKPHRTPGSVWTTPNGNQAFGLLWLLHENDQIIEIEAYEKSTLTEPLPQRFWMARQNDHENFYIFGAHLTTTSNVGLYMTFFADNDAAFSETGGAACIDSNCQRCSKKDRNYCIKCDDTTTIFSNNVCYLDAQGCPNFHYQDHGSNGQYLKHCNTCHYSCKKCTGPGPEQCIECCKSASCGEAIFDREPWNGRCNCPSGKIEANGVCVEKCTPGLKGQVGDGSSPSQCYTGCPSDSFPLIDWSDATDAQLSSQYDVNSPLDCSDSDNHLKFTQTGQGIAVPGPKGMTQLPDEWTISFWAYVEINGLNPESFFVNAFDRIWINVEDADKEVNVQYQNDPAGSHTDLGTYTANTLSESTWNYISCSLRVKKGSSSNTQEIIMVMAQGRSATPANAGSDSTFTINNFAWHKNIIYLGTKSDTEDMSFNGYLKEFKFFSAFHNEPQLIEEKLRVIKEFSYDDHRLLAYYKLSETYTANDEIYTIHDYSMGEQSVVINTISQPNQPTFELDASKALNLCYFHDVAQCVTLDKGQGKLPFVVTHGYRLTNNIDAMLDNTDYLKQDGDVQYYNKKRDCDPANHKYELKWSSIFEEWQAIDTSKDPYFLPDGSHWYICYYLAGIQQTIPLAQVYIIDVPDKVTPVDHSFYQITGVKQQWVAEGGDQAVGDQIRFMEDCDELTDHDFTIQRQPYTLDYPTAQASDFPESHMYRICWKPSYVTGLWPKFESLNNHRWGVVTVPKVNTTNPVSVTTNMDYFIYALSGTLENGDLFAVAWEGPDKNDCNPNFFLSPQYKRENYQLPPFWFGYKSGIHGITSYDMDSPHICWKSNANGAPDAWIRLKSTSNQEYEVTVNKYETTEDYKDYPELEGFWPEYGSSYAYSNDTKIQISFTSEIIYPSDNDNPAEKGSIVIYKGAIKEDGSVVRIHDLGNALWEKHDELLESNGLSQGDLECSLDGICNITLSEAANRMKPGGIYFLTIFARSFKSTSNDFFLFHDTAYVAPDLGNDIHGEIVHENFWYVRSFDVDTSDNKVYGSMLTITGQDLLYNNIEAREFQGDVISDIFYTHSVHIYLRVENSNSCKFKDAPTGTIYIKDVTQTQMVMKNLNLNDCTEGDLYANIEVWRGIKTGPNEWKYMKKEKIFDIMLGKIGCHDECLTCSDPNLGSCLICQDEEQVLDNGRCLDDCSDEYPFQSTQEVIFNLTRYYQPVCVNDCGPYMYPNSDNKCIDCNPDCIACNDNSIGGCTECIPGKFSYEGICIDECPTGHHVHNRTDYTCVQISDTPNLKVDIQPLGFKNRIPKDVQQYLKVHIDNTGGTISSIKWTQLEPDSVANPDALIFSEKDGFAGTYNDDTAVIKMKMSAFNYVSQNEVFKIKCTVTNSDGDVMYDIMEFYINEPPRFTSFDISRPGTTDYGRTFETDFPITLNGFYDSIDDTTQQLSSKVFYESEDGQRHLLTDEHKSNTLSFKLPPLPVDATSGFSSAKVCVATSDKYDAHAQLCQDMINLGNVVTSDDFESITAGFESYDLTELKNILFITETYENILESPRRNPAYPAICTLDVHCVNGQCGRDMGQPICLCDHGWSGVFCTIPKNPLHKAQDLVDRIIDELITRYENDDMISNFDIEVITGIVRNLHKGVDLVRSSQMKKVLKLLRIALVDASSFSIWTIPNQVRKTVYEALNRVMGKLQIEAKKRRYFSNHVNYPGSPMIEESKIEDWEMLREIGNDYLEIFNSFVDHMILKQNPSEKYFTYRANSFELKLEQGYASEFKDIDYFVRSNDISWYFPSNVFDGVPNVASDVQEVKIKAVKWLASPIWHYPIENNNLDGNMTTIEIFDTNADVIPINNVMPPMEIRFPFAPSISKDKEHMKCQYWDEEERKFKKDGMGIYKVYMKLPCSNCDASTEVFTHVYNCKATHLTMISTVYDHTHHSYGSNVRTGIYTDFFAMDFWMDSFGFIAVICASISYMIALIIACILDRKPLKKLIRRLYLKYPDSPEVLNGEKPEMFHRLSDGDEDLMFAYAENKFNEEKIENKKSVSQSKKKGKKAIKKGEETAVVPFNAEEDGQAPGGKKKKGKKPKADDTATPVPGFNPNRQNNVDDPFAVDDEPVGGPPRSRLKSRNSTNPHSKEGSKNGDAVEEHKEGENPDEKKEEKPKKKEMTPEQLEEERKLYNWMNLMKHGNSALSAVYVTSYLSPRHVRVTLLFTNIVLIWFWSAVFYNNTKDPLEIPDFSREAREIASEDIWIALAAPIGTMFLMYIFAAFFKISDHRIQQSTDKSHLSKMLKELDKEMNLRIVMAYFITYSVYSSVFWYVIRFTASFGWKVSWQWWYSGSFAAGFNFFFYSPIFALMHVMFYRCSPGFARCVMKVRSLKIAFSEA